MAQEVIGQPSTPTTTPTPTATPPASPPIQRWLEYHDSLLVSKIVNLPDQEFWNLVSARLSLPFLSVTEKYKDREFWTEEYLIEEIFLRLAGTKILVKYDIKSVTVFKYYSQALKLRYRIPVSKPTPEFVVNRSDLTDRMVAELKALGSEGAQDVLKQAVGWIFANIDSRQYNLSIARNLEVVLKP